jgi:hypothetical protein
MKQFLNFWLLDGPKQLLNWYTAPKNLGVRVMSIGSGLLLAPVGIEWAINVTIKFASSSSHLVLKSGDLPIWVTSSLYGLGALLLIAGFILAVHQYVQDRRHLLRQRHVAVEFRGMVDTSDTPLVDAIPGAAITKEEILIDVREHVKRKTLAEISGAAKILERLQDRIKEKRQGRDRRDVQVFAGGLMPVPLQFFAGVVLEDESALNIYDWERSESKWRALDDVDNGIRFKLDNLPQIAVKEVVLAVSVSYAVDVTAVQSTFESLPIVELSLTNPLVNECWSRVQQAALAQEFLQTIGQLANAGVQRIHLILASPASLCLKFGTLYDRRNLPELVVYQYERQEVCKYPWGVLLGVDPHGGVSIVSKDEALLDQAKARQA